MKVFAYGTLKQGFRNHGLMIDAGGTLVARDIIPQGQFRMISLGAFPGLLETADGTAILGEVYDVTTLQPLDRLEGYPHFYDRKQVTTEAGSQCWVYFLRDHDGETIPSGEWIHHNRGSL